jgi:hypothetical protein
MPRSLRTRVTRQDETRTSPAARLPPARTLARADGRMTTGSDNRAFSQNQALETHTEDGMGSNTRAGDWPATAASLIAPAWAAARWNNSKPCKICRWTIKKWWLSLIILLMAQPAGAAAAPTLSNIAHLAVPEMAAAVTVMLMAVAPCLQGALAAAYSTAAAVFALRRRRAWGKRLCKLQQAAARGQASIRWSAPAHPCVPAPLAMLAPTHQRNRSQEAVRAKALHVVRTAMRLSQGRQTALSAALFKLTSSTPNARKGWRQPRKGSYHAAWLGRHIPRAHSTYLVLQACKQALVNMTPGASLSAHAAR